MKPSVYSGGFCFLFSINTAILFGNFGLNSITVCEQSDHLI